MSEESNVSLAFLGEQMKKMLDGMGEMKADIAKLNGSVENIDATVTRMHADVVDAKATGKEVALRLSLMEIRLSKIEDHIGLVKA